MKGNKKKAVIIIDKPEIIRLLASSIKSQILHLLNRKPMTATQLSKELDLTKGAIDYHIQPLRDSGLIRVDRYDTQRHGISKYYKTVASLFIVDPDYVPDDVKRYFLETQINRIEGMMSAFKLNGKIEEISSEKLEDLAETLLKQLKDIGQKYTIEKVEAGEEEILRIRIFAEAIRHLTKRELIGG
jgi:DNA-binding transcriptional ArsR family regulator